MALISPVREWRSEEGKGGGNSISKSATVEGGLEGLLGTKGVDGSDSGLDARGHGGSIEGRKEGEKRGNQIQSLRHLLAATCRDQCRRAEGSRTGRVRG